MKTKTAKQFLALGLGMIISALASEKLFEFLLGYDFPPEYWFFNGVLILVGIVLTYSGINNLWLNARSGEQQ